MQELYAIIPILAPAILFIYAGFCLIKRANSVVLSQRNTEMMGLFGILISFISAWLVIENGTIQSSLLGVIGLGFSIRLDALSISMLSMISILGFVILKFSSNYLDGDPRKGVFFSRLATTIASVELLILSGNLFQILVFWAITSVCLHYLLVFYRNRPQAIAAARKKFIVARLGDFCLVAAIALIYQSFGTGDLQQIFSEMSQGADLGVLEIWATVLLVITAVLKSAQFPTHGWLIEVVETPTPVSALLHAGLLNAGPFLMVRLGYLMVESVPASVMLMIIGGFTALFASVVYLTQPAVKISLGYSSVAHMGFSLLLCGLGVYSAAILHVVAHSFYKAHCFLSSGSAVEAIRGQKISLPARMGSNWRIIISLLIAMVVYGGFSLAWGFKPESDFALLIIGAIIAMGLSQILVSALDTKSKSKIFLHSGALTVVVASCFFTLEHAARALLGSQIPLLTVPPSAVKATAIVLVASYGLVILAQFLAVKWKGSGFGYALGVHLRNGLYANVIFDRMIGSLKNEKFKWANLTVKEEEKSSREHVGMDPVILPGKEILISN